MLIQKVSMHFAQLVICVGSWKCGPPWKDLHHKAVTNIGTGEVFKIYFWVLFCNFVDTVRDPEKRIQVKWNRMYCCLEECSSSEILFSGRKSVLCLAESYEDLFSATARRHIWWTSESWFSSDCCYGNHTRKPQRQQSCDPILALALPSSFCNATRVRMLFPQKGILKWVRNLHNIPCLLPNFTDKTHSRAWQPWDIETTGEKLPGP